CFQPPDPRAQWWRRTSLSPRIEDTNPSLSLGLRWVDGLTIIKRLFADEDYDLVSVNPTGDLHIGAVIKAGLDRSLFCFPFCNRKNRGARLFHHQGLHGHKERILLPFDFQLHAGVGARSEVAIRVLDFNLSK